MPDAPPAAPEVKPFKEFVPADYHDRGYLKDLLDKPQGAETTAELFKRLDGAQKLIGQRPAGIPGNDAKPEEVEAFLSKLRPEKAEAYDLKVLDNAKDEALVATLREAFHHAGSSETQARRFLEKFIPAFAERSKTAVAEKQAQDEAFNALVQKTFGDDNAKVLARVKGAMDELAPADLKPHLGKLSNENLAIMAGVIDAVLKKYGAEDKVVPGGNGGSGASGDTEAMRAEMSALIAKPEYRDEFAPGHAAARAKVAELAQKIAAAK